MRRKARQQSVAEAAPGRVRTATDQAVGLVALAVLI